MFLRFVKSIYEFLFRIDSNILTDLLTSDLEPRWVIETDPLFKIEIDLRCILTHKSIHKMNCMYSRFDPFLDMPVIVIFLIQMQ